MTTKLLSIAALLATLAVSACGMQGVSTARSTDLQGAPGTAADLATGGQGNSFHNDRD
jgi:outer membrane protein assembly factor BamE (lipoprotein component of BamABCDE complex)